MSSYDDISQQIVSFTLGGIEFEYDKEKNQKNIEKHGISFRNAARVFFDYDRIEFYDEEHSENEDRYNTIGDIGIGKRLENEKTDRESIVLGNVNQFIDTVNDILFVVYTERIRKESDGRKNDVIRLISARMATNFERGLYYGKFG